MAAVVICKDCLAENVATVRKPALDSAGEPVAKNRCVTHQRAWRNRARSNAHARMVEKGYGITAEQYQALYEAQGGKCFICRVATGKTKRLAVEHEHGLCDDHPPEQGCPRCIRCLSCGRCNRLIAFLGVEALCRAIQVLADPPARAILRSIMEAVDDEFAPGPS